jgi:lysophospholipase L1-like esterase
MGRTKRSRTKFRFVHSLTLVCGAMTIALAISPVNSRAAGNPNLFNRIVVVGDSLSAGIETFSLFSIKTVVPTPPAFTFFTPTSAGGQEYSYPAQVARQAQHELTLPLFPFPGVPYFITTPPTLPLPFGRLNPTVQTNNLSVPGFTVANAISNPYPGSNFIDLMGAAILGFPAFPKTALGCGPISTTTGQIVSELSCAIAQRPTLVIASIGSNDALQALTLGLPPTDPNLFAVQYTAFVGGLAATGAKIAVGNIADVTSLPYLIPQPDYKTQCGVPPPSNNTTDYIVADLLHGFINPCTNPTVRTASEVQASAAAVSAYNKTIDHVAQLFGMAVVDVNGQLRDSLNGYRLPSGKMLYSTFFGGLFSLDRIHPTATGSAILANLTIDAINKNFGARIPMIDLDAIAANDPLVPHL